MTALEGLIREEIAAKGPMRLDRYMALCLTHPEHGYYTTRDPLGRAGDFTTAPEISQMFGELIGIWLGEVWKSMGAPARFSLVEFGPGRGTLMLDVCRVLEKLLGPEVYINVHLAEASPTLRAEQRARLKDLAPSWIRSLDELPPGPCLLFANEFLDALPVRQFQRVGDVWLERAVRVAGEDLEIGLIKTPQTDFPPLLPDGAIVERAPAREAFVGALATRLEAHGGAALIIDYGGLGGDGDTLQAVAGHAFAPVLKDPGTADLSSHVDFGALARQIGECSGYLTTQGQFLRALGIEERARQLQAGAPAPDRGAEVKRLTDAAQMGTLFKVMALLSPNLPKPAGF